MTSIDNAATVDPNGSLGKPDRLPVLFIGHGSPMNAIEDNEYRRSWQALGAQFGTRWPRPRAILCISAHWLTQGWWLTGMAKPRTIHDFYGFPQALFDQQYPAPGAPALADALSRTLQAPGGSAVGVDSGEWGLDHGAWSVLKPMFPQADIPVLQLSMDYDRPPAEHYEIGRQLRGLREQGVLIVGSGNIVHNLRAMRWGAGDEAYDWAVTFDRIVAERIEQGRLDALAPLLELEPQARLAHPTHEHYLPLLYAAGAAGAEDKAAFFNTGFQGASIAMRSVTWDGA
ncbi:MAG: 4,5-DOPA dioxygenase extradiol [Proteobacteria bacterium]|nr:4,5-DOPA dioxygenase extradiol [Pseudomonadota bacterium]